MHPVKPGVDRFWKFIDASSPFGKCRPNSMKVLALEVQSVRADETVEEAVVRARFLSMGRGIPRWLARVTGVSLSPFRSELGDAVYAKQ